MYVSLLVFLLLRALTMSILLDVHSGRVRVLLPSTLHHDDHIFCLRSCTAMTAFRVF